MPFTLQQGRIYRFSYEARGASHKQLSISIQKPEAPYSVYHARNNPLTSENQSFKSYFVMEASTDNNTSIQLQSGSEVGSVTLSSISLMEMVDSALVFNVTSRREYRSGDPISFSWRNTSDISAILFDYSMDGGTNWISIGERV